MMGLTGMSLPTSGKSFATSGRSGGSKWPYGTSTYSPSHIINHYAIRQQARDAYHDTPQAKAVVDRYADNIVDTGLILESQPDYRILGITPEAAEQWAANIERRFHLWANSKGCHRSQNMNLYQMQRLYAIMQQRDNDQFVRLFYNGDRKILQSPLQLEIYDPNQIRGDAFTSTYANVGEDDGIERNLDGSEKGYKVWYMEGSTTKYQTVPHKDAQGNYHMLHGFYAEYPGQTRGYSRLAHSLQEFEKITDFTSATITRAINSAMFTMAIENSQKDPSDPFEGLNRTPGGAGPAAKFFDASTTEPESEYTGTPNYSPIPEATFSGPGIGLFNLQKGDTIKELGQGRNDKETFGSFVDAFTSYLCASQGMPIEVLLMKFSNNYSASRGTLILFWRICQIWINEMAADFLNPVLESWLNVEIALGRISAPGWADPVLRAAWLSCHWNGAPMPNIDPAKTAKADREYAEMGATTLDRIARNLNGSSAASNSQKLAREYENLPEPAWKAWDKPEPVEPNNESADEQDEENEE